MHEPKSPEAYIGQVTHFYLTNWIALNNLTKREKKNSVIQILPKNTNLLITNRNYNHCCLANSKKPTSICNAHRFQQIHHGFKKTNSHTGCIITSICSAFCILPCSVNQNIYSFVKLRIKHKNTQFLIFACSVLEGQN